MSSPTELQIAELLHGGKNYREIYKELHVGPETIKKVRDLVAQGIIVIGEDGKAVLAKPAAATIEEIHSEVMGVVTKAATEKAIKDAELDYALGNEIRQYWTLKADEKGMELRDYVRAALIFYDDYAEEIRGMEDKISVAKAIMATLKTDIVRQRKMELYYRFVRDCIKLRAQGFIIPGRILTEFYHDLSILEQGGAVEKIVGGE